MIGVLKTDGHAVAGGRQSNDRCVTNNTQYLKYVCHLSVHMNNSGIVYS
jgi:hypothetical protein